MNEAIPSSDVFMPIDANASDDTESSGSGKTSSDWECNNKELEDDSSKFLMCIQ